MTKLRRDIYRSISFSASPMKESDHFDLEYVPHVREFLVRLEHTYCTTLKPLSPNTMDGNVVETGVAEQQAGPTGPHSRMHDEQSDSSEEPHREGEGPL
ncbi:hypothetical protein EYF80_019070 [Liparis tanakae]|uniref:Uncharacterized protein n=1 Tax=Liparis tanakae TaxID=230148 RepID=A0A4Z2I074_9TELE|nr:hypothetical protein EYF80_019070 [Liparis tanakae]